MKQPNNLSNFVYYLLSASIMAATGCTARNTTNTADAFLEGPVVSCGHLIIYQLSEDNKSYIQIIIDTKKTDLDRENTWSLAAQDSIVTVRFRQFEENIAPRLCNDVAGRRSKPSKEVNATLGSLSLSMSEEEWKNYKEGMRYKVNVTAKGINFNNEFSFALNISQAVVGWLPG